MENFEKRKSEYTTYIDIFNLPVRPNPAWQWTATFPSDNAKLNTLTMSRSPTMEASPKSFQAKL